ncbi:MAG: hypothetical protein KJ706_08095 [Candidatus Omnitrophica bacterium]|nr:hypothetical protein [Candidatus Omnitrophota bacterium]
MLKRLFTTLEFSEEYYHYCNRMMFMRGGPPHWTEEYKDQKSDLKDKIDKLEEILNRLDLIEEPNIGPVARIDSTPRTIDKLKKLLSRFHKVARQLRKRHDNRNTLEIEDEYDVQDLLHALLKLEFEDIRAEEWTPSYAASSSRMDFLLKQEQTVIEVKKTSKSLKEKDVGEQLIIDIAHYRQHPDCKKLVCFVYDSEGRIGNPQGLENDLASQSTDYMQIVVIVNPL